MRKLLLLFSVTLFSIHVWGQSLNAPNASIGSTINPTTGNVGIGTTSPESQLTIYKASDLSPNSSGTGHFQINGNGYAGYTTLDAIAMYVGHNSQIRNLVFQTNETDRLAILGNGNVGIGTTNPTQKLTIKNNGSFTFNTNFAAGIYTYGNIGSGNGTQGGLHVQAGWSNNNTPEIARFSALTSNYVDVPRMVIKSNGNVGIGTTSPDHHLMIYKESPEFEMQSSAEGRRRLRFEVNDADQVIKILSSYGTGDAYPFYFNQNVGIGTTDPTYLLSVKGTIGCGKIIVENVTGWADFVFEDDYNLMPLQELDNYIQENKHLPEIPTTQEVQENGISVGEMNAKLLQKIEELTLHTIEQQKIIESLLNRVEKLESK